MKQNMKVLYAVTGAGFGGAPMHVLQLMNHAVSLGYEVALVSFPEPRLIKEAGNLQARIYPNPYFVRPLDLRKDLLSLLYVFKAIRDFDPVLVHAHSTKAGLAARFAAALLRKPVLFTAHGWAFTDGTPGSRKALALFERAAAKVTKKIICVSEYDRKLAESWNVGKPEQWVVIHNGVDPSSFGRLEKSRARHLLGLDLWTRKVIITFVGRLSPPKDVSTFLRALARLPANMNYGALIVGKGELMHNIKEEITVLGLSSKVRLMGEREEVADILSASDVFVLSSDWEGLPYTIIEAMMSGLPVVASRVGGIPELVEDGTTGFLFERRDAVGLSRSLGVLIVDEGLRADMGMAAREKALKEFTLDKMLSRTWEVYKEVIPGG